VASAVSAMRQERVTGLRMDVSSLVWAGVCPCQQGVVNA
jgi:hypothetical protein